MTNILRDHDIPRDESFVQFRKIFAASAKHVFLKRFLGCSSTAIKKYMTGQIYQCFFDFKNIYYYYLDHSTVASQDLEKLRKMRHFERKAYGHYRYWLACQLGPERDEVVNSEPEETEETYSNRFPPTFSHINSSNLRFVDSDHLDKMIENYVNHGYETTTSSQEDAFVESYIEQARKKHDPEYSAHVVSEQPTEPGRFDVGDFQPDLDFSPREPESSTTPQFERQSEHPRDVAQFLGINFANVGDARMTYETSTFRDGFINRTETRQIMQPDGSWGRPQSFTIRVRGEETPSHTTAGGRSIAGLEYQGRERGDRAQQ